LSYRQVSLQKNTRLWNGMATKFTMVAVVLAAKLSLRGSPKFGWLEKFLPLLLIAPHPALGVSISILERPRQIFNLYHLSEQRRSSIAATISKQVRAGGCQLPCNPEQDRHGNGFITAMPKWRDAMSSVPSN